MARFGCKKRLTEVYSPRFNKILVETWHGVPPGLLKGQGDQLFVWWFQHGLVFENYEVNMGRVGQNKSEHN